MAALAESNSHQEWVLLQLHKDWMICTTAPVGQSPHPPEAPPTGCPRRHGQIPSPGPQNTCRLFGQTSPQITSRG